MPRDNIASGFGTIYPNKIKMLVERFDTKDKYFCDLGSGKGDVVYDVAKMFNFKRVIGIEYEGLYYISSIKKCKNIENISLLKTDFFNIYLGTFDILFMYSTHYKNIWPKLTKKFIQELKDGAIIISASCHRINDSHFELIYQDTSVAIGASTCLTYKFKK